MHSKVTRDPDEARMERNPVATQEETEDIDEPNELELTLCELDITLDGRDPALDGEESEGRLPATKRWKCLSRHSAVNRYMNLVARLAESRTWQTSNRQVRQSRTADYMRLSAPNSSWFIDRRAPMPHLWVIDKPSLVRNLTAMRVGGAELNGHVYRENNQHPNGGRCLCMECNDAGRHENSVHFILHCPLYDAVRHRHEQSLRAAWSSLVNAGATLGASWQWDAVMSDPVSAIWFMLGGANRPKAPNQRGRIPWGLAASWTRPPHSAQWQKLLWAMDKYIANCLVVRKTYGKMSIASAPRMVDTDNASTRWTPGVAESIRRHKETTGSLPLEWVWD
jgi:hypothetical protein